MFYSLPRRVTPMGFVDRLDIPSTTMAIRSCCQVGCTISNRVSGLISVEGSLPIL
jgi:hypothetical protein